MSPPQWGERVKSLRRSAAAALVGALVLVTVSNVVLHSRIDQQAGIEWAAIHRMPDPSLTISKGIQQRYGLFFSLRKFVTRETVLVIPSDWNGAPQERQFDEFLRPVILGVSNIRAVNPSTELKFGVFGDWWNSSIEELEGDGLAVSQGRSRPNSRQPWYVWRIVSASENPPTLHLHVSAEDEYLFLDPRLVGAS